MRRNLTVKVDDHESLGAVAREQSARTHLTTHVTELILRHGVARAALDLPAANPPTTRLRRLPQLSRRHESDSIALAYAVYYISIVEARRMRDGI